MHPDRVSLALTRIEAAALRIREAAQAGRQPGTKDDGDESRYQALRREATSALAELDRLIARIEQ